MEQFSEYMNDMTRSTTCRVCDDVDFTEVLDLGEMPPANSFLRQDELGRPEKKFPLVVHFCNNCSLVQLLDAVNPKLLFREYDYLTSASKPLAEHFQKMGKDLIQKFREEENDLVVEIGGNDGVLLENIKNMCRVLNVEPARNVAKLSRERGIETVNEFFTYNCAQEIRQQHGNARLVIANNVFAHADAKEILKGVHHLIGEEGVFVFEVHWVGNLIGEGGFDQIYHEHLCYFSLLALERLMKQFGLQIFDVEMVPVHGQSMRVYVSKNMKRENTVNQFIVRERKLKLDKVETFLKFGEKVAKNKKALLELLKKLKNESKTIAGYGAPAKGNTLLNYFQIDDSILDFLTDTTPLKQGRYSPGMRIPVHPPEKLKEANPDYILLLAWNYADAILAKEKELRRKGVKFIIPVPEVRII